MDVLFLTSIFQLYPGLKLLFEHNSARKNLLLSACFCWSSWLSLRWMERNFNFGGTIGCTDSYLESFFLQFKDFKLNAKPHDAAGAAKAHSGKGPGYCYVIGRGPFSCLLGHVTALLFCLYVKLFLASIFKFVDFWSSMSCIALDIELADQNFNKELGVLTDGNVQVYQFRPPKSVNPQSKQFGVLESWSEFCGTLDVWITVSFPTLFLEM